jgi:hypothetical protein
MKEAVTKPLETIGVELANKGLSWLNSAEAFTKEQLPDFAEQVITYQIFSQAALVIAGVVTLGIATRCVFNILGELNKPAWNKYGRNEFKKEECGSENVIATNVIICVITGVISLPFLSNTLDLIKAAVAPKVYLLEYFTSLLK